MKRPAKIAAISAYQFNFPPAHTFVTASGQGSNAERAIRDAIHKLFQDPRLHRRHLGKFRMDIVVADGGKGGSNES